MALSPYFSVSNPFRTSSTFQKRYLECQQLPFLSKLSNFSVRRRFFSDDWRLSSDVGKARAKAKDLVLGNPSVIVEKGKYSYDVETLINKLSSLPPRGSIARCLDIFKNRLSLNDFSLVFKEFAARGDWQRSLRLFKYMQRQIWCKPNEHIYTIIISLLGREGLLEKCSEIFDEMASQGVIRSVFSYTALINAYGRNGQYETSLELLERMKRERVSPNILTYNTVINACARGDLDWEGLLGLFAEMRHEGVQPDLVTYNTLLSACAARGLGDEAEMVFKTMIEGGIVPEITTYSYIVETFGKLGKLEKVAMLLKEMESEGYLPDISSYNVLIEAHAKLGSIKEAMDVFKQMQAAGCVPNASTYSILLNLYGKHGRYDDVRELFLQMKESSAEPDATTYNILIRVFGEGGYFKEVVTLFHDLVEENIDPNMETYEGLVFACGKGGLHEDAKKILFHMNEKGIVPSSKAYTGLIEAYGQAALYDEAVVAFNTMNEVGSKSTIDTYNSLIHTFARGGLYKEFEAILSRMREYGISRNAKSFSGIIEGYRQSGQYEEAIKAFVEMEKMRCELDEQTLEAVLGVYCFAGLVDESKEQFVEIKASGILPSVLCYCMMLAVYAKNGRWDDAYELLDEMIKNRVSSIHQVIGQMIKGDYDDDSNWQMVEYVFDKLNAEGCGFGMRFYNTLLEALWWLGQKGRAGRVLTEATKRGLFPELFRQSKLVWSVDVHRMWEGGAYTAISLWVNKMNEMLMDGEDLPQLAAVVVGGWLEKDSTARNLPIAMAVNSFLQDNVSSSFSFPGWNNGRIVCQQSQLKQLLTASSSEIIALNNSPLNLPEAKISRSGINNDKYKDIDSKSSNRTGTELLTTTDVIRGALRLQKNLQNGSITAFRWRQESSCNIACDDSLIKRLI
ncbi:pentatricopeptide repeat-containing protein [Cucumis melo var. makuwa]|uniref:Pentatricopeptide repeat-containing protein n=1 Tax=Cucumis melo var. makuwa TaxID=1194695 RepID=A0A5A7UKU1_CUCMM|nr:pentatricopeptide repeat-containing protein [Cucumis melo var. makuwa]